MQILRHPDPTLPSETVHLETDEKGHPLCPDCATPLYGPWANNDLKCRVCEKVFHPVSEH